MLVIRNEQLRTFQSERQRRLETTLLSRFAADYPEDAAEMGEARARALVQEALRSASGRRIYGEEPAYGLLRLFVEFGLQLELAPYREWANSVLDNASLPGQAKLNLVTRRIGALTQGRRMIRQKEEA